MLLQDLEEESSAGSSRNVLRKFIEDKCTPVDRAQGCPITEFKARVMGMLRVKESDIGTILTSAGVSSQPNSQAVRVVVSTHSQWTKDGPAPSLKFS